jgi:diguanylate cyclase (GGDEF)-like protein/PAS domain S-box-containing protein
VGHTDESQQQAAQAELDRLLASETRLRALVSASADAALLMRSDGSVEHLPTEGSVALGRVPQSRSDTDLVRAIHREDRAEVIRIFRAAFAGGPGDHFVATHRLRVAPGRWVWVESRIVNRLGVPGIDALVVSSRDVTERVHAVRRLRRRLVAEDLVGRIASRFVDVRADELDAALDVMLAEVGEQCGVDRAWIFEVSTDRATVAHTHEWCAPGIESQIDELRGISIADMPTFSDWLGTATPLLVRSVDSMPDELAVERAVLQAQGIRSMASFGIFVQGALIGMIGLDAVVEERRFGETDLWMLRSIADVCGAALRRCAVERALAASEERFRAMIHHATDGVRILDAELRTVYSSPAVEAITGYSPEDAADPETRMGFLHPDDHAEAESFRSQVLRTPGTSLRCSYRARHRDGHWIHVEEVMTNLLDDPAVGGIVANMRDVTEVRRHEAELLAQARRDPLTDLPNRRLFDELVDAALGRIRRTGSQLALVYLDLDRFKLVNDSFGHHIGDALLVDAAARLTSAVRSGDIVARLSGDEFVVLCEPVDGEEEALGVADRVLAAFRDPFSLGHHTIYSTASIGIVLTGGADGARASLLRDADAAMYSAKAGGRNRAAVFSGSLVAAARERVEVEVGLRAAVPEEQLRLVYQPIVDLATGEITGAEALLRWDHPERGILTPDAFLDVAEETGMIVPIGEWVVGEACRQLAAWGAAGISGALDLHVNVSVRQLVDGGLAACVTRAVAATGIDPDRLCVEITESALLAGDDATRELAGVRACGVRLALDDFGTGHSSLSYLRHLDLDVVKIDRSFVEGVGRDEHDTAIVTAIVKLAESLGLTTVAEGVENAAQEAFLGELGCQQAQGFWFAAGVSAEDYARLVTVSDAEDGLADVGGPPTDR